MAKKTDIVFENQEDFMKKNPSLIIIKEIPAHVEHSPNYAAIRAILRSGQTLDGVKLVEIPQGKPEPRAEDQEEEDPPKRSARTLGEALSTGIRKE